MSSVILFGSIDVCLIRQYYQTVIHYIICFYIMLKCKGNNFYWETPHSTSWKWIATVTFSFFPIPFAKGKVSYRIQASANWLRAWRRMARGVPTLRRMKPREAQCSLCIGAFGSPSVSKISPSLSARRALLIKKSSNASWSRPRPRQSSQTRKDACGRMTFMPGICCEKYS